MSAGPSAAATDGETTDRDAAHKRVLRAVAAQAAVLSAAVHLLWAWPQLAEPADPRPYVFVLGAVLTVLVAAATLKADEYRRLYALGVGTLAAFLLGYVGWHGAETATVLVTDPLAIVGKAAELVGVAAFLALYRLAPPTSVITERRSSGEEAGSESRSVDDGRETED